MLNLRPVGLAPAILLCGLTAMPMAHAATVGNVVAFYNAPNPYGVGVIDGATFVFDNTSASDITGGVFTIGANSATSADSFLIPTLAAGSDFILTPGVTSDGQSGHTFFNVTGSVRDTSDVGPDEGSVPFDFTGLYSGQTVDSGIFTPGMSVKAAGDGSLSAINFLGGPDDGPCNDCYDPTIVATISTPNASPAVPESGAVTLLVLGLLPIGFLARRRA